jgi:F-type H+-transporting ATPase subunit c
MDINRGLIAIGAGIAVTTGFMTGLGEALTAAHACDAIGKNPEAEGKIRSTMILGIALAETCAIYGLLTAILLMFVY